VVPLEKREKIIKAWYAAKKQGITQEDFCNQLNISGRVLRVWTGASADPKISIKKIDGFLNALSNSITKIDPDALCNVINEARSQLANLTEYEATVLPNGHLESLLPNHAPIVATPMQSQDITIKTKAPAPKLVEAPVESLPIVIPNVPINWDFD
jgi:transcriptional regulator with XRE-family HTH domain